MENNQLFSFERNRYYAGKLLTSADFQAEQSYGIRKRRFLNEMMFGDGVVCGLGVYSLDDQSVMVDSGVAIDGWGREVVVEGALVRKLSAIEGFEALESDRALLCLSYREEAVHPVYAVKGREEGENYECNRIREGCVLSLRDMAGAAPQPEPETEFLNTALLYEDADYAVSCTLPASASCGRRVRLEITVEGRRGNAPPLSLDAVIQTPAFFGEDGDHALHVCMEDLHPGAGERITRAWWITAQTAPAAETVIIAGADSTRIQVGELRRGLSENFLMKVAVEELSPAQLAARAVGRINLEARELAGRPDWVPLAEISLQRTKSAYLIERIREDGVKRYVASAAAEDLRAALRGYYDEPARPREGAVPLPDAEGAYGASVLRFQEPRYATGVCEVPLGGARRGQVVCSDEVLHGLGRGNVLVQVGFEYLSDDPRVGAQCRNTIFGNPALFAGEAPPVPLADTAVKVLSDRGSFVAAVRLTQDAGQTVLPLRWVAIRLPTGEEGTKLQRLADKSISAEQPTVVLATRESHFFNVRFRNMEPCTLSYELTDRDSGSITTDGIYTAPGREGVYEIRISCADMPLVNTYAYAVVKKRTAAEEEQAAGENS